LPGKNAFPLCDSLKETNVIKDEWDTYYKLRLSIVQLRETRNHSTCSMQVPRFHRELNKGGDLE